MAGCAHVFVLLSTVTLPAPRVNSTLTRELFNEFRADRALQTGLDLVSVATS